MKISRWLWVALAAFGLLAAGCDDESSNNNGNNDGDCKQAELRCDGQVLQECSADKKWVEKTNCAENGQKCDATKKQCVKEQQGECKFNDVECDGNTLKRCGELLKWDSVDCGSKICNAERRACVIPDCQEGEKRCFGAELKVCEKGQYSKVDKDCSKNANDEPIVGGYCKAEAKACAIKVDCNEGEKECRGNVFRECNAQGKWDETDCTQDNGKVCNPDSLACEESAVQECEANDIDRCFGNKIRVCEDNKWVYTDCAAEGKTCKEENNTVKCVTCEDNTTTCVGNGVATCNAGEWSEPTDCGSKVCTVNGTNATCEGGDTCTDGATVCADEITISTCNNNTWSEAVLCPKFENCENDECVCTPGKAKCDGDVAIKCSDSKVWETVDCGDGVCNALTGTCGCKVGETKCDGEMVRTCQADGTWGAATNCPVASDKCNADTNECSCVDGATRCVGVDYEVCTNGSWGGTLTCESQTEQCNIAQDKCACIDKDTKCVGDKVATCNEYGEWSDPPAACGAGEVCNASTGKCGCELGTTQCQGDKIRTCQDTGFFGAAESCPAGQKCDASTNECKVEEACTDGTKKCVGDKVSTCSGGQWGDATACPGTQKCSTSTNDCADSCTAGDNTCIANHLFKCESGTLNETDCGAQFCDQTQLACVPRVCDDQSGMNFTCVDTLNDNEIYGCLYNTNEWFSVHTCPLGQICQDSDGLGGAEAECVGDSSSTVYPIEFTYKNNDGCTWLPAQGGPATVNVGTGFWNPPTTKNMFCSSGQKAHYYFKNMTNPDVDENKHVEFVIDTRGMTDLEISFKVKRSGSGPQHIEIRPTSGPTICELDTKNDTTCSATLDDSVEGKENASIKILPYGGSSASGTLHLKSTTIDGTKTN